MKWVLVVIAMTQGATTEHRFGPYKSRTECGNERHLAYSNAHMGDKADAGFVAVCTPMIKPKETK